MIGGGNRSGRGGEFAAFFDGLEALRGSVEDPLARKKRLDVDFAGLRDDLTQHLSRFELFRPLLWAFFKGLIAREERLSAEMLLSALLEAIHASADGPAALRAPAVKFVANGALELQQAGAPGVANRVLLHALAGFERAVADGSGAWAPDLSVWAELLCRTIETLPVERSRTLVGYARQVIERGLSRAQLGGEGRVRTEELFATLLERVLRGVNPGGRSQALDHLLVRISRIFGRDGGAARPDLEPLLDRLCGLDRFKAWWAAYVERQMGGDASGIGLPPEMFFMAKRSLRSPASKESWNLTAKRLRSLAVIAGPEELTAFTSVARDSEPRKRQAAMEALGPLHIRLSRSTRGMGERIIDCLLGALTDPEPDVLRAAVRTLGLVADEDVCRKLVALYEQTPESNLMLRALVLESLLSIRERFPAAGDEQRALFVSERVRHEKMARGRLRDRILAALTKLLA